MIFLAIGTSYKPALTATTLGERLFADKSFFPFYPISNPVLRILVSCETRVAAIRLIVTVKRLESLE